ncbi:MAG TPA: ferrous iron transport protein B [Gemmatimonadaceae bacterium]|nr:ferrous iron transport protein B [Gemmatimonadaceae bacterium]
MFAEARGNGLAGAPAARAEQAPLRVALVGNPNTGKSTVFNALTGMRQQVANFPGVTVERVEGSCLQDGRRLSIIDLPGTYSMQPESPDERIACDVLAGRAAGVPAVDVIVVVVDGEQIERNLYFASQVLELGRPTVIALNRMDRVAKAGTRIDIPELIHALGAVVIPVVATRGAGIDHLRRAIVTAPSLPLPDQRVLSTVERNDGGRAEAAARYAWIASIAEQCIVRKPAARRSMSDRVDAVALHRVWGPLVFLGVMAVMFQAMFAWARPLMNGVQALVGLAAAAASSAIPPGELRSLIVDGAISGVGSVLVFLPQIAILFLFIGLLEDSGYMARAAFVMDRFMRPLGLNGKSFIPLLSGYACAVPAILSTRTIKDPKERLATIMVVPLMSCSARLPVYTLLIGAFVPAVTVLGFANLQGLTLLGMYLLGTVAALAAAALFRRTLLRTPARGLILELPPYHAPSAKVLAVSVWQRVKIFLKRAGTVIFAVSLLLWGLAAYPRASTPDGTPATPEAQLAQSALGRTGRALEPLVKPLGYDWKIGVSMLSSFAAREVFVTTMSTIYKAPEGESSTLRDRLRTERDASGRLAYTPLVAVGLMAFYVFALMCTSTVAVTIREAGGGARGLAWASLQFGYMLVLAYGVALLVYRGGLAVGLGGGA